MRSCRWALPFGDVPMHPTCAARSISHRESSCQFGTALLQLGWTPNVSVTIMFCRVCFCEAEGE